MSDESSPMLLGWYKEDVSTGSTKVTNRKNKKNQNVEKITMITKSNNKKILTALLGIKWQQPTFKSHEQVFNLEYKGSGQ